MMSAEVNDAHSFLAAITCAPASLQASLSIAPNARDNRSVNAVIAC